MNNKKIFIIAGEASGDNLGAKLIRAIKDIDPTIEFYGIGGDKIISEGVKSLFPMTELSLMGFVEIIPYIPKTLYRINQTFNYIKKIKPDIVITIDSPGFNFRIGKKIKKLGIKLVHYVAPTVWAYKPERAKKISEIYDHLIVILPFEPKYFIREGLSTSYVGHPIIEDYNDYSAKNEYNQESNMIAIFPGSRKGEVKILLPIFLESIKIIKQEVKDLVLVIPTIKHLEEYIFSYMKDYIGEYKIITDEDEKKSALPSVRAAIVKSGTISFEVAMASVPMVIAYKINKISAYIIRKLLKIKNVNLINIISGKYTIKEYLQEDCTPENIAGGILELLKNNKIKQEQIDASREVLKILGLAEDEKPSTKAAKIILNLMSDKGEI